jgi:hypothetical protein
MKSNNKSKELFFRIINHLDAEEGVVLLYINKKESVVEELHCLPNLDVKDSLALIQHLNLVAHRIAQHHLNTKYDELKIQPPEVKQK